MIKDTPPHDADSYGAGSDDADFGDASLDDAAEYPYEPVSADQSPGPALPWGRTSRESLLRAPRFLRDHWRGASLVGAVVGVILLSGATAWGVSVGVSASTAVAATSAAAPGTGLVPGGVAAGATRAAARGQITAIDGSTWTVTTAAGKVLTVTITRSTRFGTAKAPATATDFSVGSAVVVIGHRSASELTATRVAARPGAGGGSASTGSTTS